MNPTPTGLINPPPAVVSAVRELIDACTAWTPSIVGKGNDLLNLEATVCDAALYPQAHILVLIDRHPIVTMILMILLCLGLGSLISAAIQLVRMIRLGMFGRGVAGPYFYRRARVHPDKTPS